MLIQVIETNLLIDENNEIRDHQSRIVEVDDWDTYCMAYKEYNGGVVYFRPKSSLVGSSIPPNCRISNLQIDDFHLSCDITKYRDGKELYTDRKLAYKAF